MNKYSGIKIVERRSVSMVRYTTMQRLRAIAILDKQKWTMESIEKMHRYRAGTSEREQDACKCQKPGTVQASPFVLLACNVELSPAAKEHRSEVSVRC